ncbi:hypothetical protein [Flindersiella endophytica]
MATRETPSKGVPVWARVPGIIVLVLAAVLGTTMLVGAAAFPGTGAQNQGPSVQNQNQQSNQNNEKPRKNQKHGPGMHGPGMH